MKKPARKTLAGLSIPLLLVLLANAPRALSQQPAPKASPATGVDVRAKAIETAVDASIPGDQSVDKMLAVYSPKVRELDVVLGTLKGELRKGGLGSGSLGNFITDGLRAQAGLKIGKPVALAIMNSGGIRRQTIGEGELKARDIFELLPFENALITVDVSGEQLMKLLQMVLSGHAQSGARIIYRTTPDNKSELVSAQLRDATGEKDIDPKATYTITTIDYIYRVGGNQMSVILHEGKNMKELGITLRDAIMNYVKSETAAGRAIKSTLDGRFALDKAGSPAPQEVRQ